jgi:hypothetical protein
MNKQQAREILSVYRPGTEDEHDPMFAEALALARTDRELKTWFEESTTFDRGIRAALARVDAPIDLRDVILAEQKIVRPAPWWNYRLSSRQLAAAAAVVVLATVSVLWFNHEPPGFAEFRREIADSSWGPSPHVEMKASSLDEVRRLLAAHHVPTNFNIPPALAQSEITGCSIMHWRGNEVPLICFHSEKQHLHLVVVDRSLFPDAPTVMPVTDQWSSWRTASWTQDDHAYVLTGLKTLSFVKKFRKSGRWDWEG